MFTFTGRISAKRKAPDAVVFDEGIAPAISEEKNTADGRLAAGRKLTAKVNMATIWECEPPAASDSESKSWLTLPSRTAVSRIIGRC